MIWYLLHIIHMFHWWFDHLSFLLFLHRHFLWLPFRSMTHEIFSMHYILYTRVWVFIIGYSSLVSLHFFHPITLAYVMSRILRPPWGHEIGRYLWQFLLGWAYVDWLKYSRYHVFFYGKYFWKHLVSLSYLIYRSLLDFLVGDSPLMMLDSSFCCASDIHIGAYFPFALRSLVMVGLCGYPWSWSLRCLIDVI